jgi:hypothetical protein
MNSLPAALTSFSHRPGAPKHAGAVVTDRKYRALVNDVRSHLTDDLRKAPYRGNPNPMAGHCYVASEAIYHKLGGKSEGWTPMFIKHEGAPHWFLKHEDGAIIDATADQFKSPVPYDEATGKGFLTRHPSERAQTVLDGLDA